MKIDVQGSEAFVLAGAHRTLQHVRVAMLELSIVPFYRGESMFFDMLSLMDRLGFAMYDLPELHYLQAREDDGMRRRDMLIQVDGLFVRKTDPLWSERETGFAAPVLWGR